MRDIYEERLEIHAAIEIALEENERHRGDDTYSQRVAADVEALLPRRLHMRAIDLLDRRLWSRAGMAAS